MPELSICRERILSNNYYDFISNQLGVDEFEDIITEDTCIQQTEFIYNIIHVEREIAEPLTLERYSYNAIPKCYTLLDTDAMTQAGILQVQNYPTLNLQGSGVMIGFIDTGIDYQNPVFRNLDGSTRIAGIWDQTIQGGESPRGLFYGTEYRREQIDEALRSNNPLQVVPSRDEDSHGTFLAIIAAGGPNE